MTQCIFYLLTIVLSLNTTLNATTYYLDYSGGSNSNNGLSPETAWKDLQKIRDSQPQPGDVYLLKRGEVWPGKQLYITTSGTAASPITYGAYGLGSKPVITAVTPLFGAETVTNWTEVSSGKWHFLRGVSPGRLLLNGQEELRSSTLDSLGIFDNEGVAGTWFYEDYTDVDTDPDTTDNVLIIQALQNPANLYSSFQGSRLFNPGLVVGADHIRFENLDFQGGRGATLSIRGSSFVTITGCKFGSLANSGVSLIDNSGVPTTNVTVTDNYFDSNFTFYYGYGSERGCGDGIQLFYGVNNCIISNNFFKNWAHNGIELLADIAGKPGVEYNQIFDNQITAPDIPYSHPMGADGLMGLCRENAFYRNRITECRTASQINGNNNWVHHNVIIGMERSPCKLQPTAHAFAIGIYAEGLVSQNNRYDHNLIINTDESAFLIRGYGFSGQVSGHRIRNNIFYDTGLAPYGNEYAAGTGLVIYDTNLDGLGPNTYVNNLFYGTTAGAMFVYRRDDDSYFNAAGFNALNGVEGNTIGDNLEGDPEFTDFTGGDYLPIATSLAVNAGFETGLTLDANLMPRNVGGAPDIGPFENSTPLPVEWADFSVEVIGLNSVSIHWSTLQEVNTAYFAVERSGDDGRNWSVADRIAAQGNTVNRTDYTLVDQDLTNGKWYYRIRQVDTDGQQTYSKVKTCTVSGITEIRLARLSASELKLIGPNNFDWKAVEMTIIGMDGKTYLHVNGEPSISIDQLPRGTYRLLLHSFTGEQWSFSFVR